jgi:hypothetical protein
MEAVPVAVPAEVLILKVVLNLFLLVGEELIQICLYGITLAHSIFKF